eukprot:11194921-Lingulodinium_polyedra.AAC.1
MVQCCGQSGDCLARQEGGGAAASTPGAPSKIPKSLFHAKNSTPSVPVEPVAKPATWPTLAATIFKGLAAEAALLHAAK